MHNLYCNSKGGNSSLFISRYHIGHYQYRSCQLAVLRKPSRTIIGKREKSLFIIMTYTIIYLNNSHCISP